MDDVPSPLSNLTDDAHCIFGMRQEKPLDLRDTLRGTKQIVLHLRATQLSNMLQLLGCFDAFGDDPHVEISSEIGDGADDGAGFIFVRQTGNEAAIDLNFAEWKTQQIAERGVASAEIIHRKLHTK